MILERLQYIFTEVTGKSDVILTPETGINDSIGVNSFAKVSLVIAIEEEFDIEIPNARLAGFRTVGDIVDYLSEVGIEQ